MEKEKLKSGFYIIKADTKDYTLTEQKVKEIDNLDCKVEHKDFFKKLFSEPTPKTDDLLVELVGENPFLKIKSIKNTVTGVDITDNFKEVDNINPLVVLTNKLQWIPQNV